MCVGILIIIIIIYMCTYLSSYAHAYACTYVCTYVCIYRYERDACDPERRTFHLGDGPVEIFNCVDLRLAKFKMTKLAEHAQQPPCCAVCPLMRAHVYTHTHAQSHTWYSCMDACMYRRKSARILQQQPAQAKLVEGEQRFRLSAKDEERILVKCW